MCGVVGFYHKKDAICEEKINACLDLIQHRGPDGRGVWADGRLALGHCRLSIVDLSNHANQPFYNESKTVLAVVNGEFYDFTTIREQLISEGHEFTSHCDSKILIHLYEKHGIDAVHELNGEWAFLLYDARIQTMYAARDPFGIKPLFYYRDDDQIVFASEIKSFLAIADLEMNDDVAFEARFLDSDTAFKSVYHVMPGHVLSVDSNLAIKSSKYTDFKYLDNHEYDLSLSEEDYKTGLLNVLDEAVKIRLYGDVPVGVYLSGGLDSTLVLALMLKYNKNIHAFAIGFPNDTSSDESSYIRSVVDFYNARGANITLHFTEHDNRLSQEELDHSIWHTENMYSDDIVLSQIKLSKLVRDAGFKTVLTGQGADEIFGGYFWMMRDCGFNQAVQENLIKPLDLFNRSKFSSDSAFLTKLAKTGSMLVNPIFWSFVYQFIKCKILFRNDFNYIPNKLRAGAVIFDEHLLFDLMKAVSVYHWPDKHAFSLTSFIDMHTLYRIQLNIRGDRVEMANSVEGRLPFLDKHVVEYVSKIPPDYKVRENREKYILYEVAKDLIPDSIYQRTKHGLFAKQHTFVSDEKINYIKPLIEEYGVFYSSRTFRRIIDSAMNNGAINSMHYKLIFNSYTMCKLFCHRD